MRVRFISGNRHKIEEVEKILASFGVDVVSVDCRIEELQTENVSGLVHDKLVKAFELIGRPLFVEHTGLYLDGLNGLPAGLTQIFWDRLKEDRFAALVAGLGNSAVIAKTVVGYCDGRTIHQFEGAVKGHVPLAPAGPTGFQWDCVFVPEGHSQTFAEMGEKKNEISMRSKALAAFAEYLNSRGAPREC